MSRCDGNEMLHSLNLIGPHDVLSFTAECVCVRLLQRDKEHVYEKWVVKKFMARLLIISVI